MRILICVLMLCLPSVVQAKPKSDKEAGNAEVLEVLREKLKETKKVMKVRKVRNSLKRKFDFDDTIIIPIYRDYDYSKLARSSNGIRTNNRVISHISRSDCTSSQI